MSDGLIPISDEQAKLGQEIVKAFRGLGGFFTQALGSVPEDLVGYLGGDWLRARRTENIARLLYETKARLEARGVTETEPATLSIALPILQGAADEDRDELVDLWARLLSAAMDPKRSRNVRKSFIDTLAALDPLDALVLQERYKMPGPLAPTSRDFMAKRFDVSSSEIEVSVLHLHELKCLLFPSVGDPSNFVLTSYGSELVRACSY